MCGIVHVKKAPGQPAWRTVLKRFNDQRSRGTRGFGYVAVKEGIVVSVQRAREEAEIAALLRNEDAEEIMFHHRMPTSTPNYVGAAHPITIDNPALEYRYEIIHNGVINNADKLKKDHEELGFVYSTEYELETITETKTKERLVFSGGVIEEEDDEWLEKFDKTSKSGFNDSESLAYELALVLEGWKNEVDITGGAAFMVYQVERETNRVVSLYYGSNAGRPLVLEVQGKGKKAKKRGVDPMIVIKSEGKGTKLDTDTLYRIEYTDEGPINSATELKIGRFFQRASHTPSTGNRHSSLYPYGGDDGYGPRNVHTPRVGFSEKNGEDADIEMELGNDDINSMFPDDDVVQQSVEEAIERGLAEEEGRGWQNKSADLLEAIISLDSDMKFCFGQAEMFTPRDEEMWNEGLEYKRQLDEAFAEFNEVNAKLLELNLPVPTRSELSTIIDLPIIT